jgi:predicted HAD superfamily Cof-like phosphohydrolase
MLLVKTEMNFNMKNKIENTINNHFGLLHSLLDRDNPIDDPYLKWSEIVSKRISQDINPYIDEVEEFNKIMGKEWQNRTIPTINKEDADFVINFIQEELDELKEAVEENDIVGIFDALLDITYVGLGNGALVFGLKDKMLDGYAEVQASNLSKVCKTEEEAKQTVIKRSEEQNEPCHFEKIEDYYIVYRTRDMKVMKSINYFKPDLKKFFTEKELKFISNK